MLDWIFDGIANWVASIMTQLMDAVSGLFLDALGTDMTAMEEYFPFVISAYNIIQYTAWAILFLTVVWQLFRAFGGPLTEAENPWHLLIRGSIFAVLIAYSKPVFSMVLDIARAPYLALMDSAMDPGDFTFAGIEQALSNGLVTFVSMVSVVGLLLLIIMMIALAWNYFKLLLETVERYVLVGVLCYTSPLAYSMGASKATSRVFQSWCRMVGSQLLLLVLNVWFLRAFNSSVGQFVANGGALTTGKGSIFLWLFCALALLKIAQKCDSHLATLGLSVAQTGSSMGMEMLMAARIITGFSKGGGQNASSTFAGAGRSTAGTAGGTGGILSGFANRYKPRVTASVKQASENPYEKALKKYAVGNRYVGTVSLVDLSGVFVSLDGGIDCLCTHPKRGRPPRGARVTVRILGINNETNRIWGVITHMSTTR